VGASARAARRRGPVPRPALGPSVAVVGDARSGVRARALNGRVAARRPARGAGARDAAQVRRAFPEQPEGSTGRLHLRTGPLRRDLDWPARRLRPLAARRRCARTGGPGWCFRGRRSLGAT
jgi:hypothetical protein